MGTFGVSSAAYLWSRLFAAVGRWVMRLMVTLWQFQLVFVDDLHMLTAGPQKFLTLWMLVAAYELLGTPFSYHKFKGGIRVDFIGYHLAYDMWSAGLSERRTAWILRWVDDAEENNWMVWGRSVIELTGRLGFVARLLLWMRPFLSPLLSWTSVLARGTVARMPALVHLVLVYIRRRLGEGLRLVRAPRVKNIPHQVFRTDAQCADCFSCAGGVVP